MHRTDSRRNCVVQNRTKSLSCLSLATMQDGSGVTWTRLINGFNSLASSLDILINSHISSLSFFSFAFRSASLTCCLFLGKSPCDWNPSKPPASSNSSSYTWEGPFHALMCFLFDALQRTWPTAVVQAAALINNSMCCCGDCLGLIINFIAYIHTHVCMYNKYFSFVWDVSQ